MLGPAMKRVLVVEDDPDIVELISHYLENDGFAVEALGDGAHALHRLQEEAFDLVVLDLQLPGMDGLRLCAALRRAPRTENLPIIMLTARGDESDRIVGLEVGADDYVVKPFSPKELVARARALFRRIGRQEETDLPLRHGLLEVDRTRHTARWEAEAVDRTPYVFAHLVPLLVAEGRVVSRLWLLESVLGFTFLEGSRYVEVQLWLLREKLPFVVDELVTV